MTGYHWAAIALLVVFALIATGALAEWQARWKKKETTSEEEVRSTKDKPPEDGGYCTDAPDRDAVEERIAAAARAKREATQPKAVEPSVWALAATIEAEARDTLRWQVRFERRIAKLERAVAQKKPKPKARAKR